MTEKKTKASTAKAAKPVAVKRVSAKTAKKKPSETITKRRVRSKIYGPRANVTVRFEEDDHEALSGYCHDEKTTAQSYILSLVRADLKKKGRL